MGYQSRIVNSAYSTTAGHAAAEVDTLQCAMQASCLEASLANRALLAACHERHDQTLMDCSRKASADRWRLRDHLDICPGQKNQLTSTHVGRPLYGTTALARTKVHRLPCLSKAGLFHRFALNPHKRVTSLDPIVQLKETLGTVREPIEHRSRPISVPTGPARIRSMS